MPDDETTRTELLKQYHALPVARQQILQAVAVHYVPMSTSRLTSLLKGALIRETPTRFHANVTLTPQLKALHGEGLLRQDAQGHWQVHPLLVEPVTRHAVRDGLFERLARAVDDLAEISAGLPAERANQSARLAIYRGDGDRLLKLLGRTPPALDGENGFWNAVLDNPFDAAWMRRHSAPLQGLLLRCWLNDASIHLHPSASAIAYGLDFSRENHPAAEGLRPAVAINLLMRERFDDALAAIERIPDDDPRRYELGGWRAACLGQDAAAREAYEKALVLARRKTGRRKIGLRTLGGLFYPLVMIRSASPADWRAADDYLQAAARDDDVDFPLAYAWLREVVLWRLGRNAADFHALQDRRFLYNEPSVFGWLRALLLHWAAPESARVHVGLLERIRARADAGGYGLWRGEVDLLLAGIRAELRGGEMPKPRQTGHPAFYFAVPRRQAWEASLEALQTLAHEPPPDPGKPAGRNAARLVWNVGFSEGAPHLAPLEQSLGKSGKWSKGRPVALQRLMQQRDKMTSLTDQDRAVAATLRVSAGGNWGQGPSYYFELGPALMALAGHPLVFREDAAGVSLTVVEAEPEILVSEEGNELAVSFWPNPADFEDAESIDIHDLFSEDGEMIDYERALKRRNGRRQQQRSGRVGEVVWELETPTRLKVVHLDPRKVRPVADVIGAGLRIPMAAREQAMASLAGLSDRVRVQGALDGAAAETVDADTRIWLHLLPSGETLRVEPLACPLGAGGPTFRPGMGGAAVFAEADGRRVRAHRDLVAEKRSLEQVLQACPSLGNAEASAGAGEWRFPDLLSSLTFLEEAQALGDVVSIAWPQGGKFSIRKVRGPGAMWLKVERDRDWFGVGGGMQVDEALTLDMARLLELRRLAVGRFLPLGNGEFVALTDDLRKRLDELASVGDVVGGTVRMNPLASLGLERFEADGIRVDADHAWREQVKRYREASAFQAEVPPGLKAELRDYQADGFRWLARLARWGVGACLADDMGLGKTVQTLALLLHRAARGPALVVAPMSLGFNWAAEAARFAPALSVTRFGDGDRDAALSGLRPYDLVVVSYGLLQQESERLTAVKWATVVLDEAQAIKNMQTKRSKAAMGLNAEFRLITTGTPLENHLGELWNLFHFLNPGLLGTHTRFQERFAGPIERDRDPEARSRLRRLVRPFMLRRTKSQVLEELPPRTEIDRLVEAGPEERALYEALRRESLARLGGGDGADESQRFRILAEIMKLRRACCNPELVAGTASPGSAKLEAFLEILDELSENRHQALVFSQFVDHLAILRRALDERGVKYQYLDGGTSARDRQRAVTAFQGGDGAVFLISLKAGGLGLNLTAADYVIHMDPWWNPAVEDQASDRAHRIGQTRPVTVYRLVMRDTIEEKIVELHRSKRALAEGLLSGADDAGGKLDLDALLHLLRDEDR